MPKCRVCGCTQENACNPPCGWQPGAGNLCTSCAYAVNVVAEWLAIANRPMIAPLLREAGEIHRGEGVWKPHGQRTRRAAKR